MNEKNNMPDNDAAGEVFSWIIIFILLFAFWPVGLLMLLRKLRSYAKKPERTEQSPFFAANQTTAQASRRTEAQTVRQDKSTQEKQRGKKKKERSQLDKKSGKFVSTVLLLISIALFIIGGNAIIGSVRDIAAYGIDSWADLGMGIFYTLGGLISLIARNVGIKRVSRYKKYFALVGNRVIVPIKDISLASGESIRSVRRSLQAMIDAGYFSAGAYIDSGLDSLVLSAEAAEFARRNSEQAKEEAAIQDGGEPEDRPENQYMSIINELRSLNETIADIPISDKIDRIEAITAKIFRIVEENPAKLPQIRRFMNYYLPTTLKLLHSYATLEKQGIKGENIDAAKENIGRILETLAVGFEQQLDLLFKDDAIDIYADINVLENMMRQDGLSGDKQDFKTMESGGMF